MQRCWRGYRNPKNFKIRQICFVIYRYYITWPINHPGIGLAGDRVVFPKITALPAVSGSTALALENPVETVWFSCRTVPISSAGLQGEQSLVGKSANWIRNFGKRIGRKGWIGRAGVRSGPDRGKGWVRPRGRVRNIVAIFPWTASDGLSRASVVFSAAVHFGNAIYYVLCISGFVDVVMFSPNGHM